MFQQKIETTQRNGWNYLFSGRRTGKQKKNHCEKRCRTVHDSLKDKTWGSPILKSSLEISRRKLLFPVSQFQEAGLSPMIALSINSGKSILLKVLKKSNNSVDWSNSTAGSFQRVGGNRTKERGRKSELVLRSTIPIF